MTDDCRLSCGSAELRFAHVQVSRKKPVNIFSMGNINKINFVGLCFNTNTIVHCPIDSITLSRLTDLVFIPFSIKAARCESSISSVLIALARVPVFFGFS